MNDAIIAALEMVAVVFLLASVFFVVKMLNITKGAEIVAINKPKTVMRLLAATFIVLFFSSFFGLLNGLLFAVPYLVEIQQVMVILAGLFGVVAIYTAVYFYRTSPTKIQSSIKDHVQN
jgi:hypothetical protein